MGFWARAAGRAASGTKWGSKWKLIGAVGIKEVENRLPAWLVSTGVRYILAVGLVYLALTLLEFLWHLIRAPGQLIAEAEERAKAADARARKVDEGILTLKKEHREELQRLMRKMTERAFPSPVLRVTGIAEATGHRVTLNVTIYNPEEGKVASLSREWSVAVAEGDASPRHALHVHALLSKPPIDPRLPTLIAPGAALDFRVTADFGKDGAPSMDSLGVAEWTVTASGHNARPLRGTWRPVPTSL